MADNITRISHETCLKCSRCVSVCPMDRIELAGGKMEVTTDPALFCVACGHCMSVCPTQSILSADFDYSGFHDLPDQLPALNDLLPLLKSRRSMRHFQSKPVPREILEKVLDAATSAPMGVPPHSAEVVVLDEREKIEKLLPLILKEMSQWEKGLSTPVLRSIFGLFLGSVLVHVMGTHIIPMVRLIVAEAWKGRDVLTYDAPAMFIFHGDKFTVSNRDNCIIAMTYAMIAAEASGLGSCIIGMIPPAIQNSKKLREKLEIPKDNEVLGCLVLGWPKVTYNRSIPREFKSVKWM